MRNVSEFNFFPPSPAVLPEQLEPVARRVALKLVKWGMDTRQVLARFEVPVAAPNREWATLPPRIGFLVPFSEHEWYKSLTVAMQRHTRRLGTTLAIAEVRIMTRQIKLGPKEGRK